MTDEVGEKLRKLRVVRGFSQDFVASEIDVSLSSYQRYESDKVRVDFTTMVKICELYGITLDQFLHYGESTPVILKLPSSKRTDIMVSLDGSRDTLQKWITRLSAINEVL